ncbi:restriction endonuclease subunit S [Lentilitoribacter sp. Alg239-R112]|uniref:restriction endonuclease subunit S n=1 Tax=Lentilitoribacter sp. Alg239-R112 TaxID=2305987 RepID=UPI0013A6C76B|nr:restriction endonuclease subunit S [Lentilitoribacter sp. Alg239-R112]
MPRLYSPSVQVFFDRLWRADGARYLRELIANGAYGALPPGDSYAPDLPIKFVRSAELKPSLDIDLDSCPQVAQEYFIPKARARKDDILLAVKGATIASKKSVAHVKEDIGDAIVNGSIFRMQAKEGVNARFLAVALSTEFAKRQMKLALVANNGVDYLDKSLIHKLVIPTPEIGKQDLIVARYDVATQKSYEYTRKAEALLASIDDYLLSELGIVLPLKPDNTIANRMFRTNAHALGGWRFDPLFHSFKLWHAIEASPTPSANLGVHCRLVKSGFAAGGGVQLHDDDGIIQIRPTNIGSDRQLKFDRNIYLDRSILTKQPTDVLQRREVLFNNTNSQEQVGKTVFFDIDGAFVCSNHITRIATNEAELVPEYLAAVLNTYQRLKVFYSICTNWNNQSGVNVDLLRKLTIPFPSIKKQQIIADEIGKTFNQANSLRQEANHTLEKAKAEIEAILLGDAA